MTPAISETSLLKLSGFVSDHIGLWFPQKQFGDLERGLIQAAREFDFSDAEDFVNWLLSSSLSRRQIEKLASHFTVGETYFFRDALVFQAMETKILPELINRERTGNHHLRLWSAACSSGEEPYSIAILLHKLIADIADWNITILATDINPVFMQKAKTGVYTEWSFRQTPKWVRDHYFSRGQGPCFQIVPWIKKMVTFSYLNLAEDTYPELFSHTHAMNVIFCRNVLMYFEPRRARLVIEKLYRSLVDGGCLVVSPCEVSQEVFRPFTPVFFNGMTVYRKDSNHALTGAPFAFREPVLRPAAEYADDNAYHVMDNPNVEPDCPSVAPEKEPPSPTFPNPETDNYHRALRFYEQGRYPEAAGLLKAQSSEISDVKSMALLARSLSNQGELAEARMWCEKAAASDKLNPDLYYLLAVICHELGQMDSAVISLKRTLYLDPDFVLAYFSLANIHLSTNRIRESNQNFRNALELLDAMAPDRDIPGSDGLTAGRLKEIITSTYRKNGNG